MVNLYTCHLPKITFDPNQVEHESELFGILAATEELEKAFAKDLVSEEEYHATCSRLIVQYRTFLSFLGADFSLDGFLQRIGVWPFASYLQVPFSAAKMRLVTVGAPATVQQQPADNSSLQFFITAIDLLSLRMLAVEKLHPALSNLANALNTLPLPVDYEGKAVVCRWLLQLSAMRGAGDEISEQDARQLSFDLERSMQSFLAFLENKKLR